MTMNTEQPKVVLERLLRRHAFQYEKIEGLIMDALPYSDIRIRRYLIRRQAIIMYLKNCGMGPSEIGKILRKDHAAIINTFKVFNNEFDIGRGLILEELIEVIGIANSFTPHQNIEELGVIEYTVLAQLDTFFLCGEESVPFLNKPLTRRLLSVVVLCENDKDFDNYKKTNPEGVDKKYYKVCSWEDIREKLFDCDFIVQTEEFEHSKFDRPVLLRAFLKEFRKNRK